MRKTRCAGCRTTEGWLINTSLEAYRSSLRTRKQPSCVAGGTAAKCRFLFISQMSFLDA